jgi:hypothetical protein
METSTARRFERACTDLIADLRNDGLQMDNVFRATAFGRFQDELKAVRAVIDQPHTLQRLYESEINFSITTFWDDGFEVKLGDHMNGFKAETNVRTFAEALSWLDREARKAYPNSVYAVGRADSSTTPEGDHV